MIELSRKTSTANPWGTA